MNILYSKNISCSGTLLKISFENCWNTAAKVSSNDGFSSPQNCCQFSFRTLFVFSPVNVKNILHYSVLHVSP
jgi:hypothetical protein